jgi:hypothetical protein
VGVGALSSFTFVEFVGACARDTYFANKKGHNPNKHAMWRRGRDGFADDKQPIKEKKKETMELFLQTSRNANK